MSLTKQTEAGTVEAVAHRRMIEVGDMLTLHTSTISVWQRIKWYLFVQSINQATKRIINRAYERSIINSHQYHDLMAITDRALFPSASQKKAAKLNAEGGV